MTKKEYMVKQRHLFGKSGTTYILSLASGYAIQFVAYSPVKRTLQTGQCFALVRPI